MGGRHGVTSFAGIEVIPVDDVVEDRGRWLIHGPQGSGKSTLASTIAELGKTLYIDLTGEKGIRSFKGAPYSKNIDVTRPRSITALDDVFWKLDKGDHPYQAVVLDSLTAAQKMAMRFMLGHDETAVREIKQGTAPADQRTWGQTLDIMTDLATFWYGLADGDREHPMHVVMTAQTKVVDDEVSESATRTPDVQKGALSIVLASPDYTLYTEEEDNPDYAGNDDDRDEAGNRILPTRHIVRFGGHPGYRTKGRVPVRLRGKMPPILGRGANAPSLAALSRVLDIGGVPKAPARKPAASAKAEASPTDTHSATTVTPEKQMETA